MQISLQPYSGKKKNLNQTYYLFHRFSIKLFGLNKHWKFYRVEICKIFIVNEILIWIYFIHGVIYLLTNYSEVPWNSSDTILHQRCAFVIVPLIFDNYICLKYFQEWSCSPYVSLLFGSRGLAQSHICLLARSSAG